MADPPISILFSSTNRPSTPSHSTPPPEASFISSTPTASLRSSTTAKRASIISLDPAFDLVTEADPVARGTAGRIEKWLEQQCGFFAWESEKEAQSTEVGVQPQLRHTGSSATLATACNSATTSASFFWENDTRLSIPPSPATPSSPAGPHFSDSQTSLSKSQFEPPTRAHPETEAARPDSPLLGFPGLAVTELSTISEGKLMTPVGGADVDKPLPPRPSTPIKTVLTPEFADPASQGPIEAAPPISRPASQANPIRTPKHSPTSSYSSSSSSRLRNHHYSSSQSNGHPSVSQLPIGIGHPHAHANHSRTSSASSSNHARISRVAPFTPSVQMRVESSARPTVPPSSSTRTRSHSNAIPSSIKQFHLPTGMVHRSQSHAQLRNGAPVPSMIFSPSYDLQVLNGPPHQPVALSSLSGAGVIPRLARKSSKSIISPPISRTHSHASAVILSHTRQTSEALDRLESRVPSLSSSFCRNAVYIDSEDISARLDELLLFRKDDIEKRVAEEDEDEDTVEVGEEQLDEGEWVDVVKGHHAQWSMNQQIASPPNTPATGYFGSAASVAGSQAASATGANTGGGLYASPEACSSRVYLGSNPISQNHSVEQLSGKSLNITRDVEEQALPIRSPPPTSPSGTVDPDVTVGEVCPVVESVPKEGVVPAVDVHLSLPMHIPTLPERIDDEEMMEEALAVARELAVEDRMIWGVRGSLEIFDDCWSEFEDEELGVGVCTLGGVPRMTVGPGPYGAHTSTGERNCSFSNDQEGQVQFTLSNGGHDVRDGGLAPPSMSKWSLTSSIDEEKQTSLEGKPKKEKRRRSFVPFILSGDKDKELRDDESIHKENGTIGKKRSRLASFISRLSSVGSGSNTPSMRTPPMPTLSASNSSYALPALFSPPSVRSKWDSPSLPALTPNFSATPSRSSSPTALPDLPSVQRQPQVTIVVDDDRSNSSPSSSRLVLSSFNSTTCDSATPPPASRPLTPPPQTIPIPVTISRRPIPPGIVIPPLPSRPPPKLPVKFPLNKAASEGMITADSPVSEPSPSMLRPRSNSTADLLGRHVTFSNSLLTPSSLSPREQASMTLPSTLRRSVLTKSASASVLGLPQQLKPFSIPADTASGSCYDDGLVPPTPTSMVSTEDYGETRRRDDACDDGHGLYLKHPRLRAMSSLGALPLNAGTTKSKGGLKGFVGRLTGRSKNFVKGSPVQLHIIPSLIGNGGSNLHTTDDADLPTPIATDSQKIPTPKHSPSASFSTNPGGVNATTAGGGVLSGLKSYLEKNPFRQA